MAPIGSYRPRQCQGPVMSFVFGVRLVTRAACSRKNRSIRHRRFEHLASSNQSQHSSFLFSGGSRLDDRLPCLCPSKRDAISSTAPPCATIYLGDSRLSFSARRLETTRARHRAKEVEKNSQTRTPGRLLESILPSQEDNRQQRSDLERVHAATPDIIP